MHDIFLLVGPTAVGKSRLAVEIAENLGAEILNADAFQIYRGLDILTAKPDADMLHRVPHHLLSAVELDEAMSAAKFRELALKAITEIGFRERIAIVAGGSGLYVKALTHGLNQTVPPNPKLRAELGAFFPKELMKRLVELDPDAAARIDLKNPRRVIRAIEIMEGRGRSKSVIPSETIYPPRREESRHVSLKVTQRGSLTPKTFGARDDKVRGIFLTRDRADLYWRIDERVRVMFHDGVEREVAALDNIGPTAEQALGLHEIRQLLAGEISREACIRKIQQATRRYAKRQLTWFRHQTNFPQLNLTALSHQEAVGAITQAIARR